MDEKEFQPFMVKVQEDLFTAVKKDFVKKTKEISNYASESFKKNFWYDEGVPRMWNKLSEGEIDSLYTKYKNENIVIFNLLKEFKLIRNPLNCKN